jgi:hypothetical protein
MESGSTSYCVYGPGNMSPSRPPLRRAAPEHARSGFPFLIGMAALVLAAAIGSVAKFCPQDLRFESGKHPAKSTTTTAATITADAKTSAPPSTTTTPSVITPTSFTTIGDPAGAPPVPTTAKKKPARVTRSGARSTSPTGSASAAASAGASAGPALPENPYPEASPPETYGF